MSPELVTRLRALGVGRMRAAAISGDMGDGLRPSTTCDEHGDDGLFLEDGTLGQPDCGEPLPRVLEVGAEADVTELRR